MYDQKKIDLTVKYGSFFFAKYFPEYESRNSGLFKKKTKLVPKLSTNIDDLQDLPDNFKLTTTKKCFLAIPIELFSKLMLIISTIGLTHKISRT